MVRVLVVLSVLAAFIFAGMALWVALTAAQAALVSAQAMLVQSQANLANQCLAGVMLFIALLGGAALGAGAMAWRVAQLGARYPGTLPVRQGKSPKNLMQPSDVPVEKLMMLPGKQVHRPERAEIIVQEEDELQFWQWGW